MYAVSKFQNHIHYIIGDMIPPRQGSTLSQDSSLNRTPGENFYISGYKGQNEIYEDVPERKWNVLFVVEYSDPEDETVTCGSPYKFAVLNSPVTGHLGKMIISPNW